MNLEGGRDGGRTLLPRFPSTNLVEPTDHIGILCLVREVIITDSSQQRAIRQEEKVNKRQGLENRSVGRPSTRTRMNARLQQCTSACSTVSQSRPSLRSRTPHILRSLHRLPPCLVCCLAWSVLIAVSLQKRGYARKKDLLRYQSGHIRIKVAHRNADGLVDGRHRCGVILSGEERGSLGSIFSGDVARDGQALVESESVVLFAVLAMVHRLKTGVHSIGVKGERYSRLCMAYHQTGVFSTISPP